MVLGVDTAATAPKAAPKTGSNRNPLAGLGGAVPDAPDWFKAAMEIAPERSTVDVEGAAIELLTWGERGRPGLLFLHGNGANADWWDFIAPSFADDYRIAALSWSGMGRSDWREDYDIDLHVREAIACCEAAGLFDGPPRPLIVAHSFGSFPALRMAQTMGDKFAGMLIVDPPLFAEKTRAARKLDEAAELRAHRLYPTLEDALARFRFAPEQPCANLYIADHIARHSIRQIEGGFTWRFDPLHWRRRRGPSFDTAFLETGAPLALMLGARSTLYNGDDIAHMDALCAAVGAPKTIIPDAAHHVMVDQPLAFIDAVRETLMRFS